MKLKNNSNHPQNSSISLPLAPQLSAVRLRLKIQKTYQACLCKFFFKRADVKKSCQDIYKK